MKNRDMRDWTEDRFHLQVDIYQQANFQSALLSVSLMGILFLRLVGGYMASLLTNIYLPFSILQPCQTCNDSINVLQDTGRGKMLCEMFYFSCRRF